MWKYWKRIFHSETHEITRVIMPQLLIIILLFIYIIFGSLMFIVLDEGIANNTFVDVFFFSFTTLATIGYGNITPKTDASMLFCIAFCIIGIPMTLLTLANLGKYLTKCYWMALVCFGKKIRWRACENAKMPMPTILALFAITFAFGSLLFYERGKGFSIDDIYFSIISFATVGFGDRVPPGGDPLRVFGVLLYVVWGMILMTNTFSVVSGYLRTFHYLGRRLRGARDVHIWFGGQSMKVSKLLEIVAEEFNVSPHQLKGMLRDLDGLITAAIQENQVLSRRSSTLFRGRSPKKRMGYSLQEGFPAEDKKSRYNFLKAVDTRPVEPIEEEEFMINKNFFKERQSIDRSQSVDLGELNRRTILKYEI